MIIVHKQNGQEQKVTKAEWDKFKPQVKEMYRVKSTGTAQLPEAKKTAAKKTTG